MSEDAHNPNAPAVRHTTPAPRGRIDAVVFDLDGTLADTLADIGAAMDRVLAAAGFPQHGLDDYRLMIGHGLRNLVTLALPEGARDEATIDDFLQGMRAEYGAHCLERTRLYDGVAELLARLRERGLRLGVLSNKADELTRRVVEGLTAPRTFDLVLGARPDVPLKPDPAAALLVAGRLGVAPAAIAYVGDSDVDMRTATAAGMLPIGAAWGLRPRDELVRSGAAFVIDHPLELLGLLG